MDEIRSAESAIREVHTSLKERFPNEPLYFPFQLSTSRSVRAFQGYVAKWPRDLLFAIPGLAEIDEIASKTLPTPTNPAPGISADDFGTEYRRPDEDVNTRPDRDPHYVDPNLVDRALRGHRRTQTFFKTPC